MTKEEITHIVITQKCIINVLILSLMECMISAPPLEHMPHVWYASESERPLKWLGLPAGGVPLVLLLLIVCHPNHCVLPQLEAPVNCRIHSCGNTCVLPWLGILIGWQCAVTCEKQVWHLPRTGLPLHQHYDAMRSTVGFHNCISCHACVAQQEASDPIMPLF